MTNTHQTKTQLLDEIAKLRHRITELEASESKREQIEAELNARALQQAVVAELGLLVLAGIDLPTLLAEATVLVAGALRVEYSQVLELLPDRDLLLLRAGIGWQEGLVGNTKVDAQPDSQLGYTLFSSEPVIVKDLQTDNRFKGSSLLHDHAIVSGVSVLIDGEKWPYGVLSIHTSQERIFTKEDINILQAVANVLATAIEHKRTQDALREAHDKLEIRVKERTAELETANEELKNFAYTVSHDLRAPLVNIKGFIGELRFALEDVQSIIDAVMSHLDEEQQQIITTAIQEDIPEAMSFIDSSVTHMDHLVNAILKLSRLGRRELEPELIDMDVVVQKILQTLAHRIEQSQANVIINPLPQVVADQTSMEQIIANILTNAVVYLEPNRPGEIEIKGEQNSTEVIFSIRDNGRGIAKEDMHKVFELFRRAGKQDVPGEGMGLAYVRTLVRRHGGRIWCQSGLGKGTTFTFTISSHLNQGDNHV